MDSQIDMPSGHVKQAGQLGRSGRQANEAGQIGMTYRHGKPTGQSDMPGQTDMPTWQATGQNGTANWHCQTAMPNSDAKQVGHTEPKNLLAETALFSTPSQLYIIEHLQQLGDHITNVPQICTETGVPERTARRILTELETAGYIRRNPWREGKRQGLFIELLPPIRNRHTTRHSNLAVPNSHAKWQRHQPPILEERKRDLSISPENQRNGSGATANPLLALSRDDIAFFWPELAAIDFGPSQLRQIFERLEQQGKEADTELCASVRDGLTHADAALAMAGGTLTDQHGNGVADPRAYIFRALAKDGYYAAPKGYVSPETQRMRDKAEQAKAEAEARKAMEKALEEQAAAAKAEAFQAWRAGLDPGELESLRASAPGHAKKGPAFESWLRTTHWPALQG
jgi:DNA-binding MarR family transcriptional regulator